jgi:demethylmenaquinone methyltransferase/2-methoxy-6-polyprenyl-1,4-benzoquinol methylase
VKNLYNFYFKNILPNIGKKVSKNDEAYTYLPESVQQFPEGRDFMKVMKEAGFTQISQERLTFGIATLYTGLKKS